MASILPDGSDILGEDGFGPQFADLAASPTALGT
jgi:hypothetical protein